MIEHWKDIKGFEGFYAISTNGRITRLAPRILVTFEKWK